MNATFWQRFKQWRLESDYQFPCGCYECINCRWTPNPRPGCTKHTEPCGCKPQRAIAKGQSKANTAFPPNPVVPSPYTKEFGIWLHRNFDRLMNDPEVFGK